MAMMGFSVANTSFNQLMGYSSLAAEAASRRIAGQLQVLPLMLRRLDQEHDRTYYMTGSSK